MGWSAAQQGSHIFHQVQSQQVQLSCHGAGFGRRSLRLSLMNLAVEEVLVEIPKGTLFIPASDYQQTLICSEDTEVRIDEGGTADLELSAYCGISSAACPSGAMDVTALQAPSYCITSQRATWTWTDSFNPSELSLPAGVMPASQETDLLAQEYPGEDFSKYSLNTETTEDGASTSHGDASSDASGSDADQSFWGFWGGGGFGDGGGCDGGGDGGGD
eukprot:CAMPEP_0115430614 /NCGR_PEP_ID=MMETSP0271-20121206/31139_1 /TAXON_ID=71861 /ORGANISM="Scrippsiella trochoidea, Strain CCMP3099" /LENGTH=216 /DNA_ID=CAMNT_0002855855 /DNA_START=162 /DNA_END=812 /DNA_ORIENTATION=+